MASQLVDVEKIHNEVVAKLKVAFRFWIRSMKSVAWVEW